MQSIKDNLNKVLNNIRNAEKKYQRPENSVQLLAVSKKHTVESIKMAYQAGQSNFGENYLQEALLKQDALKYLDIDWHFIGAIQSNKTKMIATHFDWVHCIDKISIAEKLNAQRPDHLPALNICIQINISLDPAKSGINEQQAPAFVKQIARMSRLKLRGLMTITALYDDTQQQHADFAKLHDLYRQLQAAGYPIDTLSMGMSNDMDAAIAAGSTMVRIGTAIFGERPQQ